MGKLRIGTATPASMGAIKKVMVGLTQVWPESVPGGITNQPFNDDLVTTGVGGPVVAGVNFMSDGTVTGKHSGGAVIGHWYLPTTPGIGASYNVLVNGSGSGNGITTFPPNNVPFNMASPVDIEATGSGGARVSFISWAGTYTITTSPAGVAVGTGSLSFSMEVNE